MKRIFVLLLTFVLCISLCACGSGTDEMKDFLSKNGLQSGTSRILVTVSGDYRYTIAYDTASDVLELKLTAPTVYLNLVLDGNASDGYLAQVAFENDDGSTVTANAIVDPAIFSKEDRDFVEFSFSPDPEVSAMTRYVMESELHNLLTGIQYLLSDNTLKGFNLSLTKLGFAHYPNL